MKRIKLPKGFLANGIHCGLKKKRKDLSLFYSEKGCKCAALFTSNVVKAAPVILAQKKLKKSKYIQAVIVNSGNANCMTGKRGIEDAKKMAKHTAKALNIPEKAVLVSSTGVIGKPLPLEPIVKGLPELVSGLSRAGLMRAAEGIMTTDSFYKAASRNFVIGSKKITLTGACKGAGMINPRMATMLCYILTDADITKGALKKALAVSNEDSFNAITVDGDMSTNDTVLLLANGEAKNALIKDKGKGFDAFLKNLKSVTMDLAKMIVRDGEGAGKLIEVRLKGAKTKEEARRAADAIADSLLTKCAVHGGDPNWGRVAASIGSSGIKFDPGKMDIKLDGTAFFKNGKIASPKKGKSRSVFKKKEALIEVSLHQGKAEAAVYTCDITKKYITINASYTT